MDRGSLDLWFDVKPSIGFPINATLVISTNIGIEGRAESSSLRIKRDATHYLIYLFDINEIVGFKYASSRMVEKIRVVFHNEFVSINMDDRWITTFTFQPVYLENVTASVSSTDGNIQLDRIVRRELGDWRDAIYVDIEQTAQNALSSILQQRPVLFFPKHDGTLSFMYERATPPTVPLKFVSLHQVTEGDSQSASSDGIVYYSDTAVLLSQAAARRIGFVTRIYRLPELDTGAIQAARVIQQRALQSRIQHTAAGRVNLALEVGDIAEVSETEHEYDKMIVESVDLSLSLGKYTMTVRGRNYE